MDIYGLQKMTLLDFPGRVACTAFLGGCDFRCPYCHNYELAELRAAPVMTEEDLYTFLEKRRGLLDGVAVTGGEPCLQKDLPGLLGHIRDMGFERKLDTNGNHPDMLRRVIEEGLVDYVAMDIKNSPEKYVLTAGTSRVDLGRIRESISILLEGRVDYEFRTTLVREFHGEDDLIKMCEMIRGADHYYLQPFVDRETVPYGGLHTPDRQELEHFLALAKAVVPGACLRGSDL